MMKILKGVWDTFFPADLPYRRILVLTFIWFLSVALSYVFRHTFIDIDIPVYFPLSVFKVSFLSSGVLYAILFILVLYFTIKYKLYSNIINTYLLGISLIV